MRINGFEQIKAFYSWVFNNPDKVRPTHISLYLFLWNQGNRANWVEWFKCPYDLAMQGACIGNKGTYYKCLDELQSYNLIKYKKGLNNYKAPQIHLIKLYDSVPLSEQVTVPLSEPQTEQLSELLTGNIYKLLTDNYKLVNSKLHIWIKNEKLINDNKNIPTFEDFKKYSLEKKPKVCINTLKLKYESWIENDWKNGNGKSIKNWKSTLLNTLPYIKEVDKKDTFSFK
jgi:hypothetical protein